MEMADVLAEQRPQPWDTAARKSIIYAMNYVTEVLWRGPDNQRTWFAFGGCLFWLLLWWVVSAYILAKFALWAAVELLLLVALAGVAVAGGLWRLTRLARR